MRLSQLISASNAANIKTPKRTHSILIYGMPKVGKTELAATIARLNAVENIYWFDLENGADTILDMYRRGRLTEQHLDKITLIKVPDTRENPTGMETLLKAIATRSPVTICEEHGKVACPVCIKAKAEVIEFCHSKLTHRDVIVIDSMSQAGVSALNMAMLGKAQDAKAEWDHYGMQGRFLSDLLTVIQAAQYTNFICITHVQVLEDESGKDVYSPMCGTKTFSAGVAKYFGSIIYAEMKMKKHKAGSSTQYNAMTQAGSRIGIVLEKEDELDLSIALPKAGLFLEHDNQSSEKSDSSKEVLQSESDRKESEVVLTNSSTDVENKPPVKRFGSKQ